MKFFTKAKDNSRELFDAKKSGVQKTDAAKTFPGYTLYEGKLLDRQGRVINQWKSTHLGFILPDGTYLAAQGYEKKKWGRYSWDDVPLWEKEEAIHHEITLSEKGTILTFGKECHTYKGREIDFDTITEYDLQGNMLSTWSTWEHSDEIKKLHPPLELERPKVFFIPEKARRTTQSPWGGFYDYYRLNSLQVLPKTELGKKDTRFQEGNWLISFRHGSMLLILDKTTKEIVWTCLGNEIEKNLEGQHAPHMLPNGNILLFDNGRYRMWSRIIEFDPLSKAIAFEYKADNFYTKSEGYVQKLENGNYFITESEKGRVFEITKQKEIVWEFFHSEEQNENNSLHPESFGTRQWIYRMIFYDKAFIDTILRKQQEQREQSRKQTFL